MGLLARPANTVVLRALGSASDVGALNGLAPVRHRRQRPHVVPTQWARARSYELRCVSDDPRRGVVGWGLSPADQPKTLRIYVLMTLRKSQRERQRTLRVFRQRRSRRRVGSRARSHASPSTHTSQAPSTGQREALVCGSCRGSNRPRRVMPREIITLQVGQCGNQIGSTSILFFVPCHFPSAFAAKQGRP